MEHFACARLSGAQGRRAEGMTRQQFDILQLGIGARR
jgi:hypothetical protein